MEVPEPCRTLKPPPLPLLICAGKLNESIPGKVAGPPGNAFELVYDKVGVGVQRQLRARMVCGWGGWGQRDLSPCSLLLQLPTYARIPSSDAATAVYLPALPCSDAATAAYPPALL